MFGLSIKTSTSRYLKLNNSTFYFIKALFSQSALFFGGAPALYWGMLALLASYTLAEPHLLYYGLLIGLLLTTRKLAFSRKSGAILTLLFIALCAFRSYQERPYFSTTQELYYGQGIFSFEKIAQKPAFYRAKQKAVGTLLSFTSIEGHKLKKIPTTFYYTQIKETEGTHDILFKGTVRILENGSAALLVEEATKLTSRPSLAFARWSLHKKFSEYTNRVITNTKIAPLFIALFSGQLEDKGLGLGFSKIGLSHILAISGFHFSLVATLLASMLRLVMPKKFGAPIVALLLTLFALFIGFSASVIRAWVMALLGLIHQQRFIKTSALNFLGVALLMMVIFDPILTHNIGFALTFLCTFALLFSVPLIEGYLQKVFPSRTKTDFAKALWDDKILMILSMLLRKSLALNIAVTLWTFPCVLYFFKTFPLLSLIYNLFIPYLIGLSLAAFLIISMVYLLFPALATPLHKLNTLFADAILKIVEHPPPLFDIHIRASCSYSLVVLYVLALFLLCLYKTRGKNTLILKTG